MNETPAAADVVALARANGRTVVEVLALDAFMASAEEWLPRASRLVVGPVRPISYDEAMDYRLGQMRVKGADLRASVDYRAQRVRVDYPKPYRISVTGAGRAVWFTMLADGYSVPLWSIAAEPETYVRPGYSLDIEDVLIVWLR